jgi:hypothetical protein
MNEEEESCKICELEKNLSDDQRDHIKTTLSKLYLLNEAILPTHHIEILLKYEWTTKIIGFRSFPLYKLDLLASAGFVKHVLYHSNNK